MRAHIPVLFALTVACSKDPAPAQDSGQGTPETDAAARADGWVRGDLHFHTNYSDDAREQGGDWMEGALAVAAAWGDDVWVDAHPDLAGQHLDFVAVTDHRATEGLEDPAIADAPVVVLGGQEYGSDGHAGVWGLPTGPGAAAYAVSHERVGDESSNQRHQDAIDEVHAVGALFSVNHPLYAGDLWGWDVQRFDAVEVWNGPWSTLSEPSFESELDAWVAGTGEENPAIRVAVRHEGAGQNAQAVRFWQAWLSLGAHMPVVGGGDRHMIFPAGLPTTFVLAGTAPAASDVVAGLADGHTFVSRAPYGPQVVLEAELDGTRHPMGSALPGATAVTVHWTAARADQGQLRIYTGVVDPALPDPELLETIDLGSGLQSGTVEWSPPASGGWLHAVLVDPLPSRDSMPADVQPAWDALTEYPDEGGVTALLGALGPIADTSILGTPDACDPSAWQDYSLQCMPADQEPLSTYYVPPELVPLLHVEHSGGAPTGWAMGAITSAFHTAPNPAWDARR